MGLVCFPFHQRRRTASDASPRLLLPDDSPSSSSDARELAERVLPFVPQRVATAFSDGLYNNGATGTTELPPEPRQLQAALLLVDVSGFTKLSESFAQQSTEACEEFSLLVSSFLARMCSIIINTHGGDIDCFAGDALLVVFPAISPGRHCQASKSRFSFTRAPSLDMAVKSAIDCCLEVCRELNGFCPSELHPPLGIHAALSAGTIYAVECSGEFTPRSEAFIAGSPLQELGKAMPLARASEMVAGPSIKAFPSAWARGHDRGGDFMCMALPVAERALAVPDRVSMPLDTQESVLMKARMVKHLLQNAERKATSTSGRRSASTSSGRTCFGNSVNPSAAIDRLRRLLCTGINKVAAVEAAAGAAEEPQQGSTLDRTHGFDALMTFVPQIIRQRCLEGMSLDMLAENRMVSLMFMVSSFEGTELALPRLKALQLLLREVIDVAEGEFGGTTRQITMDEKGLAAIFVFGLPGFLHTNHSLPCLSAATKASAVMKGGGIPCNVGIALGLCFCGLVGIAELRCEYAVIGDAVNTSARIAWLAHKLSHDILCTEEFKASLEAARSPAGATLVPAGSVTLKGKQTEVAIYAPDPGRTLDQSANLKRPSRFWDLPVCEALEETIAGFIYEALDKKAAGLKRRMLVIEAPPGAGKSFLLSFIQHEVVPSIVVELGHEPAICLRLHAVASNMPYGLCHQVLQKLLEMDGAPQAARFSRLEAEHMLEVPPSELPALLTHVARQLDGLRGEQNPFQKSAAYQSMYLQVIREGLQRRPTVLLVDDAASLDPASMAILAALGRNDGLRADYGGGTGGLFGLPGNRTISFAVVMTTTGQLPYKALGRMNTRESADLLQDPAVTRLQLPQLGRSDIEAIALQVLAADQRQFCRLTSGLLDLLVENSGGLPLHTTELCRWLDSKSMLDKGSNGVIGLREKVQSGALRPPSLDAIIGTKIDQLPPRVSVVLKLACIQGYSFDVELLHLMVEAELKMDMGSLLALLCDLGSSSVIEMVGEASNMWQFSHTGYQHVLYRNILHRDKRKLHRMAADLLQQQLSKIESGIVRAHSSIDGGWEMRVRLAYQMRMLLMGAIKSSPSSFPNITAQDLGLYLAALKWMANRHLRDGQLRECSEIQAQLLELVDSSAPLQTSLDLVNALKEIAEYSLELLFALTAADSDGHVLDSSECHNRKASLGQALDQLHNMANAASRKREASDSWAIFKANTRIAQALAMFVPRKRMPKVDLDFILACFSEEQALDPKMMYGIFIAVGLAASRFTDVSRVAQELYKLWETARFPVVTSMVPVKPLAVVMAGLLYGPLMCGDVDHPGHREKVERDITKIDNRQRQFVYGIAGSVEGAWEPQCSRRVQHWQRALDESAEGGVNGLWHTVTKAVNVPLNHSEKKTPLIWPYLHANSQDEGGDAASGVKAAADAQGQWAELVDQAAAGLKAAAYPLCPILLSRNLIHAGCRVLFPVTADNQTGPQAVTALGLEHLKVASAALSKCLGFWESERIHDDIGCNLLPASLVWARAMLHWFQWQLQVAGCISPRDIEDPRLRHSVSGWPEGPALPHGPRAICGRLLVAQAMSLSDPGCPEPLTALVPATTALARLLVGQGRVFGTGERPKHTGIVPLEPVAPQASDTRQHTIRVLHVKAGSTLAFRVASSHLVGALRHIRVAGNAIKGIGNIRSISEVGDSETLWEAVSLHHAIERLLKLPGIIEGQGTCGGRMYRVARNAAGDASLDYNVYT